MSSNADREAVARMPEHLDGVEPTAPDADRDTEATIETPAAADVFETVFDVGRKELQAYEALEAEPGQTTKELAERFDRDRSSVSRWLSRLREAGLVVRRRRILRSGGVFYTHYTIGGEERDRLLRNALEEWLAAAADAVDVPERI